MSKQTKKTHKVYNRIKKDKNAILMLEHSSGVDVLFVDIQEEPNDISLTAVSYDDNGKNIAQVDCGWMSEKQAKKFIKKIKKYIKRLKK